jgi:four helix bundle protein
MKTGLTILMDNYFLKQILNSSLLFHREIFEISKTYQKEEKYVLVDHIRRSSRSVPSNIAEAWVKRKYPKSFVSKLLDSLAEEAETEVWIDMSKDFKYIDNQLHDSLLTRYQEVGRMLNSMINTPEKFCH